MDFVTECPILYNANYTAYVRKPSSIATWFLSHPCCWSSHSYHYICRYHLSRGHHKVSLSYHINIINHHKVIVSHRIAIITRLFITHGATFRDTVEAKGFHKVIKIFLYWLFGNIRSTSIPLYMCTCRLSCYQRFVFV